MFVSVEETYGIGPPAGLAISTLYPASLKMKYGAAISSIHTPVDMPFRVGADVETIKIYWTKTTVTPKTMMMKCNQIREIFIMQQESRTAYDIPF
jgi:hypothetical protein